ncbi:hypothetical protein D9619_008085 [Psilocybe cf. subviscida]|uniref:Uncharacterized protein n=1 Tax=Psilocybe cf. subviscida TaxID=2480587 RepID=A0A8H5ESP6_9AGAR|nr:hypothetical protein D9619_008085 [Psilocybe cf. subviscida]
MTNVAFKSPTVWSFRSVVARNGSPAAVSSVIILGGTGRLLSLFEARSVGPLHHMHKLSSEGCWALVIATLLDNGDDDGQRFSSLFPTTTVYSILWTHAQAIIPKQSSIAPITHCNGHPYSTENHFPAPFPRELLEEEQPIIESDVEAEPRTVALKSCLITLNNLLSEPEHWQPIIPERRHSMPSSPVEAESSTSSARASSSSSTSPLHTLVSNLRNHKSGGEMIQAKYDPTDTELLVELRERVDRTSGLLSSSDASLAKTLVALLSDLSRLSDIQAQITHLPPETLEKEASSILEPPPPRDIYDTLTRQLSDLQIERLSAQASVLAPGATPLVAVETALLWSRIDTELDNIAAMCKERTEALPKFFSETSPPQYDLGEYDDLDADAETLPDYDMNRRISLDDSKSKIGYHQSGARNGDEKMRMDLEAVTMAIDRLHLVAPQLHSQRVELKSSKLEQMEKAKLAPKEQMRDPRELERLLDMLGRAAERTMKDQSVIMDGRMQARLMERSRQRDDLQCLQKEAFVEKLIQHSGAGRMHGQDAILQPRVRDPEAMLTLPEFMRESLPAAHEHTRDLDAMLTLPEFVQEPMPPFLLQSELDEDEHFTLPDLESSSKSGKKKNRHRSLSAPPLAWLRSSSYKGSSSSHSTTNKGKGKEQPNQAFNIVYVAEHHENLDRTTVYFTTSGTKLSSEVTAEVLPSPFIAYNTSEGEHLLIKSGRYVSLPLMLPVHCTPGSKEVQAFSSHYEIKIPGQASSPLAEEDPPPLLDATQLSTMHPTSYICASCSLPVIQSTAVREYRDLPSEHWQELVEAWMCHGDQKLADQVQQRGSVGFWPVAGQGLVGGSYVLFDDSAMNNSNLHIASESKHNDNWRLTRCICGAIVGRCQERPTDSGNKTTYRILKYAIRPVSQSAEPVRIPLSAFIVEDMIEFTRAHASHRFVISDEEEEKPRIMVGIPDIEVGFDTHSLWSQIWLFKPRIRLSYATPRSHALHKSANIIATKVLFKLIKPGGLSDDEIRSMIIKYPGFTQAEYLSYPMAVCRRLAGMLKESNSAYPETLRMLAGLEVGWLQRG